MKKLKPWIVLGLVFVAGVMVGVSGARLAVRRVIERATLNPDLVRARIERNLDRDLKLTAEQRPRIHEILLRSRDEVQRLRGEFQPRLGAILKRSEGEIRGVLNDAQRRKFDLMVQKKPILPPALTRSAATNP